MIPHRTIDRLGVDRVAASLKFNSHDAYAVTGADLNDLCALAERFLQASRADPGMTNLVELRDWHNRLTEILGEALQSNLTKEA